MHDIQSKPFGYALSDNTQHVIGRRTDGTVQELWWNGRWHESNLSNDDLIKVRRRRCRRCR